MQQSKLLANPFGRTRKKSGLSVLANLLQGMLLFVGLYTLLWLLQTAWCRSSTGDRVLIVTDASTSVDLYSSLWQSLKDRSFQLTFRDAIQGPALFDFDAPNYDHLVLLAPATKSEETSLACP
jgi:oligosaccharyltransferase complex subunit beta